MQVGDVLQDRFTLTAKVGQGGMGVVFRATDHQTNEVVAVKTMLSAQSTKRFLQEAEILSTLKHPNIVRYITHGVTLSRVPYLVMEWLEGEDLAERIYRESLRVNEAVIIIMRIAEAIEVAHENGVIHRDIKPSNIFLQDKKLSRPKLIDFGIAHADNAFQIGTKTGAVIGTPGYMSPEQARGDKRLSPSSDIFSLGCVLFECLTGRPPIVASHPIALLAKIILDEIPLLRTMRRELPASLEGIVAKMLEKDPASRFARGSDVSRALSQLETFNEDATSFITPVATSLTSDEQRLLGVVLVPQALQPAQNATQAPTVAYESDPEGETREAAASNIEQAQQILAEAREVAERFGASLEALADGSIVATLLSGGEAIDQANLAARCALALHQRFDKRSVALALGRGAIQPWPFGEVIDRAASLLRDTRGPESEPQIIVDHATASFLEQHFSLRQSDTPDERLSLEGPKEESVARTLLGKPSPFIGRELELSMLRKSLDGCIRERTARAILVTAPAGHGKSRLRQEFIRRAEGNILFGRGDVLSAGAPFSVLTKLLRSKAAIEETDSPREKHKKLSALIAQHRLQPDESKRLSEFLGELAGAPTTLPPSLPLAAARKDAAVMGDQLRRAFLDWLQLECSRQSMLVVLEDLHWGDVATVLLLDAALDELRERPFMIVAFARPEAREQFPNLWGRRYIEHISLPGLSEKECERYINQILGDHPATKTKKLIERAQGNAFYLEELIRATADGDELPETILAMTQARIEKLPEKARQVLRAASFFGDGFTREALWPMVRSSIASNELGSLLDLLCQREHITRSIEPTQVYYQFRHAFLREASYATLTPQDKLIGHRLVAQRLEQIEHPDALTIAQHWERGEEKPKAALWYASAAQDSFEGNDLRGAIRCAEKALRYGIPEEIRGPLLLLRAESYTWLGEPQKTLELLPELTAALTLGSGLWYKALAGHFMTALQLKDTGQAFEVVQTLQMTAPLDEANSDFAQASSVVISFACTIGMYPIASAFVERLHVEGLPHNTAEDEISAGWRHQAHSYVSLLLDGDFWSCLQHANRATRYFERAGFFRGIASGVIQSVRAYLSMGAFSEAQESASRILQQLTRYQILYHIPFARYLLGISHVGQRQFERARALLEEALTEFAKTENGVMQGYVLIELGRLYLLQQQEHKAAEVFQRAIEQLAFIMPAKAAALAASSYAHLALLDTDSALEATKEALSLLEDVGTAGHEDVHIHLAHAEALFAKLQIDAAKESLSKAKQLLLRRAKMIKDDKYLKSFLESRRNARLIELSNRWEIE